MKLMTCFVVHVSCSIVAIITKPTNTELDLTQHQHLYLNSVRQGTCCQRWDLNPRLQVRLQPERSTLDRSATLTHL